MINDESTVRMEAIRRAAWYCLQKEVGRQGRGLALWMLAGLVIGLIGGYALGLL